MLYCFFFPGCYLSFPANKLVSGEHCKIVQDEGSGLAWLEDMRYRSQMFTHERILVFVSSFVHFSTIVGYKEIQLGYVEKVQMCL